VQPRRAIALAVLAALALGGAGLAVASGAAASRAVPARLQVDSVGCTETVAPGGQHRTGSCTYVLTDGRRFRCPLSFSNHNQTPRSLERAPACKRLRPIFIPRAWRRVFARMYAVQACLARRGITANGGPFFEPHRPHDTPIGELIVFRGRGPTGFIAFYTSARVARRAEPRVIRTMQRIGGQVERTGSVTVVWLQPPPAQLHAVTEACAF
jgi:hypothetical protein